jgi:hypothetical protein
VKMLRAFPRILFGLLLIGCNEDAEEVELRTLQASTEMSFVCRDRVREGHPMSRCPDLDNDTPERSIVALITQTVTDEVAVVDLLTATVEDQDFSVPGFSLMRMPSRPGDIVTTPGGKASFVGLTGVGKTGISAIPTNCIGAPFGDQYGRDVTTLPACSLPSIPGDMVVLIEPPTGDDVRTGCDPSSPLQSEAGLPYGAAEYEVDCGEGYPRLVAGQAPVDDPIQDNQLCSTYDCRTAEELEQDEPPPPRPPLDCRRIRDCSADLTQEGGPTGRRKLVVAMPDEGRVVVIDAQAVLDGEPGKFAPCPIELSVPLQAEPDPAGQDQDDYEGLHPDTCEIARPPAPPNPPSFAARPSGMAAAGGKLYVGDEGVPNLHVLDASTACGLRELPPLLPMAFEDPTRSVTTSRVAVSPLTPSGKRFVYAVDPNDRPAASMMAFDVSPGSTNRTPVLRQGSLRTPGEQADRIQFHSPVSDVAFALRDLPQQDDTGVAPAGLYCDPDPATDPNDPAALYRPAADFTQGARPELLRGLFGFAMLTNGDVMVIDVDDFDAPCRRPQTMNPLESADFRGCKNDQFSEPLSDASVPTVTQEVSCNMVQPHRVRSAVPGAVTSTSGVSAPSLRAFPQFETPERSVQFTPDDQPKLLAVNFPSPDGEQVDGVPPEVYSGGSLYRGPGTAAAGSADALELETDPNRAEQATLTLPLVEPRVYSSEAFEATYEGAFSGTFPNGFLDFSQSAPGDAATLQGLIVDTSAAYCDHGVYDEAAVKSYAAEVLGFDEDDPKVADEPIDRFAESHADYVQITGDFPDAYDPYWVEPRALVCGGRQGCLARFGSFSAQDLDVRRDLRVIEAYQDHLVLRPRVLDELIGKSSDPSETLEAAAQIVEGLECCFPQGTNYVLRASNQWVLRGSSSGFRHDVVGRPGPDPDEGGPLGSYRCQRDCDPRRVVSRSRAFEITSSVDCVVEDDNGTRNRCGVGARKSAWFDPCTFDPGDVDEETSTGVKLSDPAAACILENLTARFAVYRGLVDSQRDMRFRWETTGGFIPLTVSLRTRSASVLPQRIQYLPELQSLFITDAAALGLSLAPLDTLRIDEPWPVF